MSNSKSERKQKLKAACSPHPFLIYLLFSVYNIGSIRQDSWSFGGINFTNTSNNCCKKKGNKQKGNMNKDIIVIFGYGP